MGLARGVNRFLSGLAMFSVVRNFNGFSAGRKNKSAS
jgi:hypothetical protein